MVVWDLYFNNMKTVVTSCQPFMNRNRRDKGQIWRTLLVFWHLYKDQESWRHTAPIQAHMMSNSTHCGSTHTHTNEHVSIHGALKGMHTWRKRFRFFREMSRAQVSLCMNIIWLKHTNKSNTKHTQLSNIWAVMKHYCKTNSFHSQISAEIRL